MERKIGEIFEYKGEWYQCVEGLCRECCFRNILCDRIKCNSDVRKDGKNISFKKLEKVGEPYKSTWECFQVYKTYCTPTNVGLGASYDGNKVTIKLKQNQEDMEKKELTINDKLNCLCERYNIPHNLRYDFISEMKGLLNREECSNSESIGKNLKPFDLEAARNGKPVCTRDGRKARIICFDFQNENPIIALIQSEDGKGEDIYEFKKDGKIYNNDLETVYDLMMLPEKHEGWVNIYKYSTPVYESEEKAMSCIGSEKRNEYVATVKISWEE